MALIAVSTTAEVILLIIGLYLFDGGLVRKFGAIGMFVYGLGLSLGKQTYVSDLSSQPTNVFLIYTGNVQNGFAWMYSILIVITICFSFISIWRLVRFIQQPNMKMTLTMLLDEIV